MPCSSFVMAMPITRYDRHWHATVPYCSLLPLTAQVFFFFFFFVRVDFFFWQSSWVGLLLFYQQIELIRHSHCWYGFAFDLLLWVMWSLSSLSFFFSLSVCVSLWLCGLSLKRSSFWPGSCLAVKCFPLYWPAVTCAKRNPPRYEYARLSACRYVCKLFLYFLPVYKMCHMVFDKLDSHHFPYLLFTQHPSHSGLWRFFFVAFQSAVGVAYYTLRRI